MIDVVEVEDVETGLVVVNAEAIGNAIDEYGRIVLDGLYFDHNQATLKATSTQALTQIAAFLSARSSMNFYVVGHTDAVGTYAYNTTLSDRRADAVVRALTRDYGIAKNRLEGIGIGPLSPVFSNSSDGGRSKNRRVELVERP